MSGSGVRLSESIFVCPSRFSCVRARPSSFSSWIIPCPGPALVCPSRLPCVRVRCSSVRVRCAVSASAGGLSESTDLGPRLCSWCPGRVFSVRFRWSLAPAGLPASEASCACPSGVSLCPSRFASVRVGVAVSRPDFNRPSRIPSVRVDLPVVQGDCPVSGPIVRVLGQPARLASYNLFFLTVVWHDPSQGRGISWRCSLGQGNTVPRRGRAA